jgi:DNA-binding ferritin-like protein (Dps family)
MTTNMFHLSRTTINRQQRIIHIRARPFRRLAARRRDVDVLGADVAAFLGRDEYHVYKGIECYIWREEWNG